MLPIGAPAMIRVQTGDLTRTSTALLPPAVSHQVYCGLDCCITWEVFDRVAKVGLPSTYDFERALQGPYMEIMQRGFLVNEPARRSAAEGLRTRLSHLESLLTEFAFAVWDKGLNPRSPLQLKNFFYQTMRLPEQWQRVKGEKKLSTNREALEVLEHYMHARPFVSLIQSIRDIGKQLSVLEGDIDEDGRFRAGYNIAGTESGRASSSSNAHGTGGNAQNIAEPLRYVFTADPGKKLCVIDLEQVEARDVGWLCGVLFRDWRFLDNCESGDLHTNNTKLIWPELPWTGDPIRDREVADRNFYRDYSFRDMSKRGGHLSNYMGTAWTAARALKVPIKIMETFQARYCRGAPGIEPAFGCIPQYWQWISTQLATEGHITTPFGRQRHFFGRPDDAATLREAIAFVPQSMTADRTNLGLWKVWKYMPEVQLLAQTHDSITFQYDDKGVAYEKEVLGRALELIRVPLEIPGRTYIVPGEAKIGWNWGNRKLNKRTGEVVNPLGLQKFSLKTPDLRSPR